MGNTHSTDQKKKTSTAKKIVKGVGIAALGLVFLTAAAIAIAKVVSEDDDPDSR